MINILTLVLITAMGYWVVTIISRKKRELEQKELQQAEQFLKETQSLLKTEASSLNTPTPEEGKSTDNYRNIVAQYFKTNGYTITKSSKAEGIDLIGIKEKELLLIRCEYEIKEIKKIDIKLFIADCSVYIDHNSMFKGRSCSRLYATNRPISDEARLYIRENTSSIRLIENI